MHAFGLGLLWVMASARILRWVTRVRREYRNRQEPVSDEALTGWIVRLMAHYRENRSRIRWMQLLCVLGGGAFCLLGVLNVVQGIVGPASPGDAWTRVLPFLAGGINLAIGGASLLFARSFRTYSDAWDRRLAEAALQLAMERGQVWPSAGPRTRSTGRSSCTAGPPGVHGHHQPLRPQLEDRAGVPRISRGKGYLSRRQENGKILYAGTEQAAEYIALFSRLYHHLFDRTPGFKL